MTLDEQAANQSESQSEVVVLVHGLAGNSYWMSTLEHRLRDQGFRCVNWTYPSFRKSIGFHSQKLRSFLLNDLADEMRVNLVAHSMGTVVVRAALAEGCPQNLGRVVFLAPPNRGTTAAFRFCQMMPSWFPTIAEISSQPDSYVNCLPAWNGNDLGVLAAKYDILVPFESTQLANQTEHAVVNTTHIGLAFSRQAAAMIIRFLKEGHFSPVSPGVEIPPDIADHEQFASSEATETMTESLVEKTSS